MSSESDERIVKEDERRHLTGVSRTQWWRLERNGLAPARLRIGLGAVGWRLSEILQWISGLKPAVGCSESNVNVGSTSTTPVDRETRGDHVTMAGRSGGKRVKKV